MSDERTLRFAVIGAGMAGILTAIKLREAGRTDFTVYEKGDSVGGTWRENSYPGLACDVPSHLYSYSFEPNPEWSHLFSPGPEIREYFEGVAAKYGLGPHLRLGDEVVSLEWSDGRWHLDTAAGHHDEVDVVIAATGVLHHPKYPEIEGLESFAGDCFHSARWDHTVELADKRVGVIGTGSTAVQITGAVADEVGHLDVFQRTAQWIMPVDNPPYDEEQIQAFRDDLDSVRTLHDSLSSLFSDRFSNAVIDADSEQMRAIEQVCRDNLEQNVTDPELRESLRPDYRAACKRLVLSADFYDAVQRANVELVTSGIAAIEPGGVRTTDGVLHELDVLVLATGFRVDRFLRPIDVTGRGGHTLEEAWADRPSAYLSITIPGFPNLFLLNGPNGPVGNFSLIEVAELQWDYIDQLLDELASGRCAELSATEEATETFEAARVEAASTTIWTTGCNSWYLDDRGIPATWPWTFRRFRDEMAAPDLDHYERVGSVAVD